MLKGKFIRISTFIIKKERSQIDNINLHPKEVEKEEQTKAQFNMEKKKTKLRAEINEIMNRKIIEKKSVNLRSLFFEKINKIENPIVRLAKRD